MKTLPRIFNLLIALVLAATPVAQAQSPAANAPATQEQNQDLTINLGGGVTMEFILIRPGSFTMGSDMDMNSKPSHQVTITAPFYLGKYEVTQEQWEIIMGNNPSAVKGARNPVETVSWNECQQFVAKMKVKFPDQTFGLPTEAEWEYACRAGSTGEYAGDLDGMAWHRGNNAGKTHPVGEKKPNAWSLYDMHGNVWEWCADRYGDYPAGAATDPTGPNTGSNRVYRGGDWFFEGAKCRSAFRSSTTPDTWSGGGGFRVVAVQARREPTEVKAPKTGAGAEVARAMPLAGVNSAALAEAKPGDLRTADLGSGGNLLLCGIPAGTFKMGGLGADETRHQVTLTQPFWLGRTEVTQRQWRAVMGNNSCSFKGDDLPVEQVNWNSATEFCGKLNGKVLLPAGWQWALPSEAQWEYACRASSQGDWCYGDDEGTLDEYAWYNSNAGNTTHPTGTKRPNVWGLYDMHGNVWEWCADRYGDYPAGAATDPTGPNTGSERVSRGGGWFYDSEFCRAASRDKCPPDHPDGHLGFRVAAVPVGP